MTRKGCVEMFAQHVDVPVRLTGCQLSEGRDTRRQAHGIARHGASLVDRAQRRQLRQQLAAPEHCRHRQAAAHDLAQGGEIRLDA